MIKTLSIKQSKDAFIVELIISTLPFLLLLIVLIVFLMLVASRFFPGHIIAGIVFLSLVIFLAYSAVMYFYYKERFRSKEYVVTHETVTELDNSRGVTYRSFEMKGLVALDIYQSWVAKKLKFGTVTLKFMGGSHIELCNIPTPEKYAVLIHKLVTKGFIEEPEDLNNSNSTTESTERGNRSDSAA